MQRLDNLVPVGQENTNLGLRKDLQEDILKGALGSPRSDIHEKSNGEEGRRLDKYGDSGFVQPANAGCSAHGIPNIFSMQDESCNDHKYEDDVECRGDRKVWGAEVDCLVKGHSGTGWSAGLVNEENSRRCAGRISLVS